MIQKRAEAFQKIRLVPNVYDPKVLEAVAACFDIRLESIEYDSGSVASVRPIDLVVGNILAEEVRTKDGTLLVTPNTRVTLSLLEKIRNFSELLALREPLLIRVEDRIESPTPD